MVQNIKVSGPKTCPEETEWECKFGEMAPSTKDTGGMTRPTAEGASSMQMATSTREAGRKIKLMALAFIFTLTELNTKENGSKTSNTAKEKNRGLIKQASKESTETERRTEMVTSSGLTNQLMMVTL